MKLVSSAFPLDPVRHLLLIFIETSERILWLSDGEEDYPWHSMERREQDWRIRDFREAMVGNRWLEHIDNDTLAKYRRQLISIIWGG